MFKDDGMSVELLSDIEESLHAVTKINKSIPNINEHC